MELRQGCEGDSVIEPKKKTKPKGAGVVQGKGKGKPGGTRVRVPEGKGTDGHEATLQPLVNPPAKKGNMTEILLYKHQLSAKHICIWYQTKPRHNANNM